MPDSFLGEIIMFGGDYEPHGWAFCDGRQLPMAENMLLFSLIGFTYGGDGKTTFALPDLRGRIPLGTGHGPDLSPRPLGMAGGAETVALTAAELPAHTHTAHCRVEPGESANAPANLWAAATNQTPYTRQADSLVPMDTAIKYAGSNQPHENRMPYLPISFLIALKGIYPKLD